MLEVGSVLPSYVQMLRWSGEPVKVVSISTDTFIKNRKGSLVFVVCHTLATPTLYFRFSCTWQETSGIHLQTSEGKTYVLVIVRKSSCTRYNGTRGGVEIVIQYEAQPSTVWSIETRHECHYIQYSLISVL